MIYFRRNFHPAEFRCHHLMWKDESRGRSGPAVVRRGIAVVAVAAYAVALGLTFLR